jgi:hypothetical protein
MAIMVQYADKTFGHVQNSELDELIGSGKIVAFRRASGWVEVGIDPVRVKGGSSEYAGVDRRSVTVTKSCLTCPDFVDSTCAVETCSQRKSLQGKSS